MDNSLQDTSTWTCEGDSGSPLVHELRALEFYLVGILHGSRAVNCTPTTTKSPGLFANLENEENQEFIHKWIKMGDFFLQQKFEDLDDQTNLKINYFNLLDPYLVKQNLWNYYAYNEDVYSVMYFNICKQSTNELDDFEKYGVNCSLIDDKIKEICQNGKSPKENYENFGIDCFGK